jgi:ribosomal protein S18 acetylase RimI-like enzyme
VIRRATSADVDAVASVARNAYEKYIARIGRIPEPMSADYAAIVADGDTWVAVGPAGLIIGALTLRDGNDHLLIRSIAVDPAQQGRGIGRLLLDLAETQARARNRTELRLYTNELMRENQAIYARHGYVRTRREERADRVLIHMAKRLPPGP